jgi:hypothetical protein
MKSKEEIEQLAEKAYPIKKDLYRDLWNENNAYVKGYTQCQEDMAEKIKRAYEQGLKDGYACMPSINSLNKQD